MLKKVNKLFGLLKNSQPLVLIFGLGVLAFSFLLLLNHRIIGSDDTVFQTQILPFPDVFSWVAERYTTWSGRLFSEGFVYIFSPAPFYAWQLVTLCMFALFVGTLFAYTQLLAKGQSPEHRALLLVTAFSLPFLMNHHVLAEGGLWMTGSMVYFWTSTLGLAAFYPVAYYFTAQRTPHWLISSAGILSAIVAASSQEQVGIALFGITLAFLAFHFKSHGFRRKELPWYVIIFSATIGIALFVSLIAPGNGARLDAETLTWLPDFQTTPPVERIQYGYRWFLEAFINHSGFLLITSWLAMAALFARKVHKKKLDYALIFIFTLASILTLTSGSEFTAQLFNFFATWKPIIPSPIVSLNLIPWAMVLLCTLVAPFLLFPKKPYGYLLCLLFALSFATAAALLLSPTMYASLWRSFFVPSVLLIIPAYLLLHTLLATYSKYRYIIVGIIGSIALLHYVFQAMRLLQ